MISKKETAAILAVVLILAFGFSFLKPLGILTSTFASVLLMVGLNVIAKKISAFYLDSEIEMKIWEVQTFGFKPEKHFKTPIPMGGILPVVTAIISLRHFIWMASLVFDVTPKVYKAAKRHGLYTFSEMTESQIGLIAASGIAANLLLGILGYLIGFPEFARLNIYYAFFNILPLSDLDGNKIFFGNLVLWSFLASLVLIGIAYAFLGV